MLSEIVPDPIAATITNPVMSARSAGLRYVADSRPGITRKRAGKRFKFFNPDGSPVRDDAEIQRIRSLAIPPAYTDVWICPSKNGHLQATGRDARGRKQYRYHPRWREVRDESKYNRMIAFGHALPSIRRRVAEDLARRGLPRSKVLGAIVQLLETTLIRVGNDEYARENKSYGLTTMQVKHVDVEGATIHFRFRGKSGKNHEIDIKDRRLATIIRRCQELPGRDLFDYVDEAGETQHVGSGDVNDYLREISGQEFTAKDFRTWAGTVLAALALREFEQFEDEGQAKKNIVKAIETVAHRLGNTPTICRKCYVHPVVLEAYLEGSLGDALKQRAECELIDGLSGLPPEEAAVLALLQQRLGK